MAATQTLIINVPPFTSLNESRLAIIGVAQQLMQWVNTQLPSTNMQGQRVQNVGTPQSAQDAVTVQYLQSIIPQVGSSSQTIGQGPTTQNVLTGSRVSGTTYHNTGNKPLYVTVSYSLTHATTDASVTANVDSSSTPTTNVGEISNSSTSTIIAALSFVVLPGYYYKLTQGGGSIALNSWVEWS